MGYVDLWDDCGKVWDDCSKLARILNLGNLWEIYGKCVGHLCYDFIIRRPAGVSCGSCLFVVVLSV